MNPRATCQALIVAAMCLLVAACGGLNSDSATATITATDVARLTRTLASDDFAGRGPAMRGEAITLNFLRRELERIGVEPFGDLGAAGDRTWLQRVPAAEITVDSTTAKLLLSRSYSASQRGQLDELSYGNDFIAWTSHEAPSIDVTAPLVFAGYGIVAPTEDWNDYKRDLRGTVVVVLVNDPPVPGKFGDDAMTYYGRWTYKYEEAARQGAAGMLIIHDTEPAGYDWDVVRNSWAGAQFSLPVPTDQPAPPRFEGWVSQRAAAELFSAAGLSLTESIEAAASPDFEPVDLHTTATIHLDTSLRRIVSHNVVGRLRGSHATAANEYILWTAHWDHLGEDPRIEGDGIYNGALDNATGVAGLLEIAEAYASLEQPTRRSHLFMATTLEEKGLLGSAYYAANPIVPPRNTVAAINIDGLNIWGATKDITVIGLGNSQLDDILRRALEPSARSLSPDPEPTKGFYYRSDHFPIAKIGIPALYTDAGVRFLDQPEGYSGLVRRQYTTLHYHRPSDEFDPTWNLAGAEADLRALFAVGFELSEGTDWPTWSAGSEFSAVRAASLGH